MPKRKRLFGDDSSDDGKRRRKMDTSEICQELYETIRNQKSEDGRLLCEAFVRAPKRRNLADYYDVVANPMDLMRIQQKIKMEEYDDVEQMTHDFELLVNNAKSYYKSDAVEYLDACTLWNLYLDTKNEILGSFVKRDFDDASSFNQSHGDIDSLSNSGSDAANDEENPLEELFSAVMTATAEDGRSLSTMFQLLPSKLNYADYYNIITEPIDLKMIATKIQNITYAGLTELEKDLLLMVRNAKTYNEPGSQIYKDANTLRKIIIGKKNEIEQRKFQPLKTSERIRAKRLLPSGQKWSAVTAALKYEDLEAAEVNVASSNLVEDIPNDEGNVSDPEDADTNPMWQMFEAVRTNTNAQGIALSDPFMRLPSRRFYPDYYKEIKQPMSLAKIRAKIKAGIYENPISMVEDLNIMFENAKRYNRPDSKIFKDACKLQKIMQTKAQEILNISIKEDEESDSESEDVRKKGGVVKQKRSLQSALSHELKKARRSQQEVDSQLKKRMRLLYKTLLEYCDETGRSLIAMFMEKPSKKDYPDYFEIIANPMDMKTIDSNIKWERYLTEEALLYDFRLMLANCKQYNEDGSMIYKDAVTLENVLNEKLTELGPFQPIKIKKPKTVKSSNFSMKLRTFYNTVKDYIDPKGRQLSLIFTKLPSKTELPDYYEVIKKPVDLDKIGIRLKNNYYESLEDLLSDLILMLDNACKYNEPDSQIYKDALSLQQIALQTKLELADDNGTGVPDIKALVQELLTNLFISVYNHQDEEGRCFSDSIIEFLESEAKTLDPNEPKPLSFDLIKRNLDKGKYRRLDRFQKDMFEVFERTRRISRTDSQAFEDSIELQSYFIRLRNDLCRNGETLISTALQYTEEMLNTSIEELRCEKLPKEQQDGDLVFGDEMKQEEKEAEVNFLGCINDETMQSVTIQDYVVGIGDFVYIEHREKTMEPHIIHVEKFEKDACGEIWINGCWFYRPSETFHIASKRFLEKEVFKSDNYNSTPLNQVVGKCFVMFVKDYFRCKPQEFDDKDVYVCESRYFTRAKTFKKIKVWPFFSSISLVIRENPLPMIRVPSVFKDQAEKPKEVEEEDNGPKILDIERVNIICDSPESASPDEGSIYYEQFTIPSGTFKIGDCCYVRTDQGRNLICRIDRMWVDKEGNAFFHGPWFVQPQELPPHMSKMCYPQEVFLSSIEDTNPLLSICDRCIVYEYRDYVTKRPTEVAEQDVYICESRYLEHEKKFQKLSKGLAKFSFTGTGIVYDEIYILRKPLSLQKTEIGGISSPAVARKGQSSLDASSPLVPRISAETDNEESNDQPPVIETPVTSTPVTIVKKKGTKRLVTGYIIFASEVRKSVVQANPECSFGDISRIIGTEWKNLPQNQKSEYEQKAQRQNEESAKEAAAAAAAAESLPHSPASSNTHIENATYECHWEKCDFQFEETSDLLEHLIQEPAGHVWQSYGDYKDKEGSEFQCLFQGCGRVKKGAAPFPSLQRLIRHCKEIHVSKQNPKILLPENRGKNFVQSRKNVVSPMTATASSQTQQQHSTQTVPQIAISNAMSQNSNPNPALSMSETTSSINVLHPTLSQAIGTSNTTNLSVLNSYTTTSGCGVQVKPVEPIFVATPPKTTRVLHTSTYIKYIEKLRSEAKHISDWQTQLRATPDNTPVQDTSRLPINWLANGAGNHGSVVNALWALRNFMLQDALNLSRIG